MNRFAGAYLYGLDAPLPPEHVEAYVTALVCIARENGIVESESRVIHGIADILGAMPFAVTRALGASSRHDLEESLRVLADRPSLVAMLYRDALLVARADGEVSADEQGALMRMATQLALSRQHREAATEAADLLAQVRQTMAQL